MAFTFQINNDLQFIHDEALLSMAEVNHPQIKRQTVLPTAIVDLVEDETKLNGYGVKESEKKIENLQEYNFRRDEKLILDFGDHQVGSFKIDIDQTGSPMDAPLYLRLKFAEMPAELAAESSEYEGWLSRSWIQEEFIHIDELPMTLELPRRYSFRYVELKVIDTSPKVKMLDLGWQGCDIACSTVYRKGCSELPLSNIMEQYSESAQYLLCTGKADKSKETERYGVVKIVTDVIENKFSTYMEGNAESWSA